MPWPAAETAGGTMDLVVRFATVFVLFSCALFSQQQVASPWETYLSSGVHADEQKRFTAAEQFMTLALREAEHFGANDPRLGSTLNTQGLIFMAQKKPKEAEPVYRRALAIFQKIYGAKGLDVVNICLNLSHA